MMKRLFALAILFNVSVGLVGCSDRAGALLFGEDDKEDQKFYASEGATQIIGDGNTFTEINNAPAPTPTPTP
jgi:hypothetical protein